MARINKKKLLVGLGISIISLEIIFRLFGIDPKKPLFHAEGPFRLHPTLGWSFKPNYSGQWTGVPFETNSLGLRGENIPPEKTVKETRVLVLGGSVTAGNTVPLDKTFVKEMESDLRPAIPEVRVINAGIPGYSTNQQMAFLNETGLALKPDLVVLDFAMNDVMENEEGVGSDAAANASQPRQIFRADGTYLRLGPTPRLGARLREIAYDLPRQTATFTVVRWAFLKGLNSLGIQGDTHRQMEAQVMSENVLPATEQAWNNTEEDLLKMSTMAKQNGVPMVIVMFPVARQLDSHDPQDRPQRLMKKFCDLNNIPFVDLLPIFRNNSGTSTTPYFVDADHPSREGHRVAGQSLASVIRSVLIAQKSKS